MKLLNVTTVGSVVVERVGGLVGVGVEVVNSTLCGPPRDW